MKKLVIGITGSFGTGKSTVAKILASYGVKVIDADRIVHGIIGSNNRISKKIIKFFGKDILNKNSTKINRRKLGQVVFQKQKSLRDLCKIIHPEVIRKIKKQLAGIKKKVVAIDAPLLVEAGFLNIVDRLIVVKASRKNQIKRIKIKMKLNSAEIQRRIDAQIPLRKKIKLADYVVDNNDNISFTKSQVKDIYKKLLK
ncbi:MAG: dephospho-CoA kinase [Candidatus Omnitrophota bacterium]